MNNWKERVLRFFGKNNPDEKRGLVCGLCEKEKKGKYCNFCKKETQNKYTLELSETITTKESFGVKQKRLGISGWLVQMFQGFKTSTKFSDGVDLHRKLDREKDWYDEVVRDEKTGKIINECHEPLSKHVGHGSAKMK